MKQRTALLSVSDKTGIVELARSLVELDFRILSTGGTLSRLRDAAVQATQIADYTGFPEILDGRVKTLHPRIHAGILARHSEPAHARKLAELEIDPVPLVVVNLYPFQATVSRPDVTLEEAIEQIDIGGPTMLRAAAKNFQHVAPVVDPADYPALIEELRKGGGEVSLETRKSLALKTFQHTAGYDAAIANYLAGALGSETFPSHLHLVGEKKADLRYGENPHQEAALYLMGKKGVAHARQLQGKELSYNNYVDLEAAWALVCEFSETACVIIKHTNPCGAACSEDQRSAYSRALECDPVSAFGSIIAFNGELQAPAAEELKSLFVEAIIAPSFHPEARQILAGKKNLRMMEMEDAFLDAPVLRQISGGVLMQTADDVLLPPGDGLRSVTSQEPSPAVLKDLLFAFAVCKHVKSNAIVFARDGRTLGVGAGQMSRVDSVRLAAEKARLPLTRAVMASDAFFPFRDGIDAAAEQGISAVIQPGGSRRDDEVIAAAEEHGMSMVLTGMRHFRH